MRRHLRVLVCLVICAVASEGARAATRRWTDSTGTYNCEAEFLNFTDGSVELKTVKNKIISVPLERLSHADQEFVKTLATQIKVGDKVVTTCATPLLIGKETSAVVEARSQAVVTRINGTWAGVRFQRDGKRIVGWVPSFRLARADDDDDLPPPPSPVCDKPVAAEINASQEIPCINETDFDEQVLRSEVLVLVDFYADWCGPCRTLSPVLEELARETSNVRIVKVNVDQDRQLAERYEVSTVPCLVVFKNGQVLDRHVGAAGKDRLKSRPGHRRVTVAKLIPPPIREMADWPPIGRREEPGWGFRRPGGRAWGALRPPDFRLD